ncbi:MAG: putative lipid II flippase FtsW [Christensenellales bacterium]|jgi:cell division protein FtsW
MQVEREPLRRGKIDYGLLAVIGILSVLGLMMVFSAGSYSAQDKGASATEPLFDQLLPMVLGVVAMIALSFVDYRVYRHPMVVYGALFISLFLLGIVWIPGIGEFINGSRRWIRIPVANQTIQPGEIAKFTLILYIAHMLTRKVKEKEFFKKTAMPVLIVCGMMFGLVMLQPNLSTAGCLVIATIAMLMIGGMKVKHIAILFLIAAVAAFVFAMSEDYRRDRLIGFMDPWGMSGNEAYQLTQSLLAIASGGIFGVGIGQSRQKLLFLPYCDSDFIFAIVCEELGFVGAVTILALFGLMIFAGFRVALRCKDRFGSMLAAGISVVFAVQVVLNVAVVIGLFPTTGLPLPFFSAGGSNLVIFMAAAGILLNISRYSNLPVEELKSRKGKTPQPLPDNVRVFRGSG